MAIVNRTAAGLAFNTSNVITIPAVASGNSLIVALLCAADRPPTACTDNGGGSPTYTLDVNGEDLQPGASDVAIFIYRRNNITTAPTQITITTSTQAAGSYAILEYDNLDAASFLQFNKTAREFVTSRTATVTTATADEIGLAFAAGSGTISTSSDGWTQNFDGSGSRIFDNPNLGAAGSKSVTVTQGPEQWMILAFYTYGIVATPSGLGINTPLLKEPNVPNANVANATNVTVNIWHSATISGAPDEVLTNQSITDGILTFPVDAELNTMVSYIARWTADSEPRFFRVLNVPVIDRDA
jgi:hypothetical protein